MGGQKRKGEGESDDEGEGTHLTRSSGQAAFSVYECDEVECALFSYLVVCLLLEHGSTMGVPRVDVYRLSRQLRLQHEPVSERNEPCRPARRGLLLHHPMRCLGRRVSCVVEG